MTDISKMAIDAAAKIINKIYDEDQPPGQVVIRTAEAALQAAAPFMQQSDTWDGINLYARGKADGIEAALQLARKFIIDEPTIADTIVGAIERLKPEVK